MSAMHKNNAKRSIVETSSPYALMAKTSTLETTLKHASWLGVVAGLRSMTPLAALTWTDNDAAPWLRTLTAALAVGELVGDKLPFTPSRLKGGSLIVRVALGATAGALLCKRAQQSPLDGVLHGALGAVLGSVAGYAYRSILPDITGVPDVVWAIGEDAVALGLSVRATAPDPS